MARTWPGESGSAHVQADQVAATVFNTDVLGVAVARLGPTHESVANQNHVWNSGTAGRGFEFSIRYGTDPAIDFFTLKKKASPVGFTSTGIVIPKNEWVALLWHTGNGQSLTWKMYRYDTGTVETATGVATDIMDVAVVGDKIGVGGRAFSPNAVFTWQGDIYSAVLAQSAVLSDADFARWALYQTAVPGEVLSWRFSEDNNDLFTDRSASGVQGSIYLAQSLPLLDASDWPPIRVRPLATVPRRNVKVSG